MLFSFFTEPGWVDSLIGIVVGGGVLCAIAEGYYRVRHEEGLGMGDVKMLAMIGAFLGWQLTSAHADDGVVCRVDHRRRCSSCCKRGDMKYALPFGTFLALGAALAATVGPPFLDWYLGLLGVA